MSLLAELLFEIVGELLIEILTEGGAQVGARRLGTRPQVANAAIVLALLFVGGLAGYISALVLPTRLTSERPLLPGLSLVLAPMAGGVVMALLGRFLRERGRTPTPLATWWGGATFAFAYALVRFVVVR